MSSITKSNETTHLIISVKKWHKSDTIVVLDYLRLSWNLCQRWYCFIV